MPPEPPALRYTPPPATRAGRPSSLKVYLGAQVHRAQAYGECSQSNRVTVGQGREYTWGGGAAANGAAGYVGNHLPEPNINRVQLISQLLLAGVDVIPGHLILHLRPQQQLGSLDGHLRAAESGESIRIGARPKTYKRLLSSG